MNNKDAEIIKGWIGASVFVAFLVTFIVSMVLDWRKEKKAEREFGKETYEVVITDKYECLGSTFHLVGGRSTETEYHLGYRYRCTNRPDSESMSSWEYRDSEVSHSTWSRYNAGDRFTTNRDPYFLY